MSYNVLALSYPVFIFYQVLVFVAFTTAGDTLSYCLVLFFQRRKKKKKNGGKPGGGGQNIFDTVYTHPKCHIPTQQWWSSFYDANLEEKKKERTRGWTAYGLSCLGLTPLQPETLSVTNLLEIGINERFWGSKGVNPFRAPKPLPILIPRSNFSPNTGFVVKVLIPLEPHNPSLYKLQVNLSQQGLPVAKALHKPSVFYGAGKIEAHLELLQASTDYHRTRVNHSYCVNKHAH